MTITVLIADDHEVFRMGLNMLISPERDIEVVGEAGDGQTAIQQVRDLAPDVVVMDISMPDMDGIEATQQILAEFPDSKIIALSIHGGKEYVEDMLRTGAAGYVLKESALEELASGIRAVQRGELFLSASIQDVVLAQFVEGLQGNGSPADEIAESTLLTTKLHYPGIARHTVVRAGLIEELDAKRHHPLTLISAPAGYGKSTLVGQWLELCDWPSAWLSLDEYDNDLRTFLNYLVAAVQTQFAEALPETGTLLAASNLPSVPVLSRTLVNELQYIPQRFILVLDDYHRIGAPEIHELLGELLRYPPQTLHLVLITRTDPALDLLYMRAHQKMGEVRTEALSFSVKETADFLERMVGTAVEEGVVREINSRSEGWVTGMRLLTLSVKDSADLADLSTVVSGEQQTLDYLAAEALARQPRDIQAWLLQTSILDRFCASLCTAVCAPSEDAGVSSFDGEEFMQWLVESNLFVIDLDRRGQWYRYHHLFQELLQNQLDNALSDEEIADLHSRTSHWYLEHDLIEEAIAHALKANDMDGAARIVEVKSYAAQDKDAWFPLEKWLAMLPESLIQQRPKLLMVKVHLAFFQYNFSVVIPSIERVQQILNPDEKDLPVWGEINFVYGYFELFNGQGALSLEHFQRALELIPQSHEYIRREAQLQHKLALQMVGRKEEALLELNQLLQAGKPFSALTRTRYWAGLYFVHLLDGNLPDALYAARQLKLLSADHDLLYAESWGVYGQALVHFYQNNQEEALPYFSWLADKRFFMHMRNAVDSLCGLALLSQLSDQRHKVAEKIQLLLDFVLKTNDPNTMMFAESCQARIALMQGDIPAAWRWLQTADLSADQEIMLFWIEVPRITACRVLVAEGSPASLQKAIEKLRNYQEENLALHHNYHVMFILPLLALAYHKQKQDDQALAILQEALALAAPGKWIWPFIELGSPMASLLRQLQKQDITNELATKIDQLLIAFLSSGLSSAPSKNLEISTPLTERELQVLGLLATKLSTAEIAEQLFVTVNTVRMHTKSIYSKLDVHSRLEAIERARELGLI